MKDDSINIQSNNEINENNILEQGETKCRLFGLKNIYAAVSEEIRYIENNLKFKQIYLKDIEKQIKTLENNNMSQSNKSFGSEYESEREISNTRNEIENRSKNLKKKCFFYFKYVLKSLIEQRKSKNFILKNKIKINKICKTIWNSKIKNDKMLKQEFINIFDQFINQFLKNKEDEFAKNPISIHNELKLELDSENDELIQILIQQMRNKFTSLEVLIAKILNKIQMKIKSKRKKQISYETS